LKEGLYVFTQRFLVSALLLASGAIPASATLTTYTDLPTFTSATSGQTFQNITFPTGSDGTTYTDPTTLVSFSDVTGLVGVASPTGWPTGSTLEANHCTTSGGCTLTITLPSTVTSVGLFVGTDNFQGFQVTVSNGTDPTYSSNQAQNPITTPFFFGFNSTVPFTTFTIASEDNVSNLFLDSIEIGTSGGSSPSDPSDTPEVATLLMLGSGLIMLRCGRRWMPRAR
jgi:hypothetical protein